MINELNNHLDFQKLSTCEGMSLKLEVQKNYVRPELCSLR